MAQKIIENYSIEEAQIAKFAKALGHPARIAILNLLASQDTCFCGDIVKELPIAQATVSQHLKELKDAGLIQGTIDGLKVNYCICNSNLRKVSDLFKAFFAETVSKKKDNVC